MKILINSTFRPGDVLESASQKMIKSEPMFHKATRKFAEAFGGPLTSRFLHALSKFGWIGDDILIDSRVHMLMPGMYPCIPGWHHDDVPRTRSDGQPNYVSPEYKSHHCMCLWGDCSLTHFATGHGDFTIPPIGEKIYKKWSPKVDALIDSNTLKLETAPERTLVFFDWNAWHRGTAATKNGFRFFIRATYASQETPLNEIRLNANVYMPILDEGW